MWLCLIIFLFLTECQAGDSLPVEQNKVNRAEVVLWVKLVSPGEGSKYLWDKVEVVKVLKNESGHSFKRELFVAHYSWEPGVPEGTCTIYLERYNRKRRDLWKLLGGSGKEGVSHAPLESVNRSGLRGLRG